LHPVVVSAATSSGSVAPRPKVTRASSSITVHVKVKGPYYLRVHGEHINSEHIVLLDARLVFLIHFVSVYGLNVLEHHNLFFGRTARCQQTDQNNWNKSFHNWYWW